jgi:hypothetical protein
MSVTIEMRRIAFSACTAMALLIAAGLPTFSEDEPKPGTPL